ncbi:hypothetical protein SELMODRAFT_104720 [Selaginella moellendorffii]|uniref:Matrin-type domain-containing protein n=1 Tax=Selaginella moellendorffii TaxID=88036 RepID=D8RYC0_SELML|nr:hypothetical protein SELMODRAFT_104720 [Selaginella moellendorffii]
MSATLLEQARSAHDDIERLERMVVKELQKEVKSHKDRLYQSHRVKMMLEAMTLATSKLVDIYEDADGARSDEIAALGGQTAPGQNNVFSAFYDRLKEIREYHRRHPSLQAMEVDDLEQVFQEEPYIEFSGEEGYGRFLDLHELHQRYVNLSFVKKKDKEQQLEYSAYIETFFQLHKIPQMHKLSRQYTEYVEDLMHYLVSFYQRTQPLQDIEKKLTKVEAEFEERWLAGKVEGWENKGVKNLNPINIDNYHSPEELVQLGGERLKQSLAFLGLKSGGTVQQRAERLWLTKLQPLDQLDSKHFAKGMKPKKNGDESLPNIKDIALNECRIRRLTELLHEAIEETKGHVEKKQAFTYEEMEEEREEVMEVQPESESEEEEQQFYNPLKLPMGWDGKPIPYWLYKLHGLGQEFKCEICGNSSYWGRRAFERHFKEWRHQHGMRCLGIPNTKNFHEITSIKDAKALYEIIQERSGMNKWRPDLEEEYEDRDGNVYNKKTYTDLQRQGLI